MKSTGVIRKVDDFGRIVLPTDMRKFLDISIHDELEVYLDGSFIKVKKHKEACVFCGKSKNLTFFKDKPVCQNCLDELLK